MQLNSQFNAQFPDVEETMNKPMDDKKIRDAALEAGLDYESRDTLYRFATILTDPLNADLERQTALMQQQADVIAELDKALRAVRFELLWCDKQLVANGFIQGRPVAEAIESSLEALAAAAPFLPQPKDEKEK